MRWFLGVVVACVLVLGTALYLAGEFGGEVVQLRTSDAQGEVHETPLWIVEDAGALWLRAGSRESRWFQRLAVQPRVELVRGDRVLRFRAVPEPARTERINQLMAERYGWADRLIDLFRGDDSMAVRLVPLGPA